MKDRASGRAVEDSGTTRRILSGLSLSGGKLMPRIVFGAEYRKKNGEMKMAAYNGLVLLEVGNLSGYTEATEVRRKAAGSLQTLLAFIGSSRKSVKIVVPFTLPDGSFAS